MSNRKSVMPVLLFCGAALSCQATSIDKSQLSKVEQASSDVYTSLCEVRANRRAFVGKIVRLHVHYQSDHMFHTFLIDKACGAKGNLIDVVIPSSYAKVDESVAAFFKKEDERCEQRKANVCPVTIDVDVEGMVVEDDGELYVDLRRIFNFKYIKK